MFLSCQPLPSHSKLYSYQRVANVRGYVHESTLHGRHVAVITEVFDTELPEKGELLYTHLHSYVHFNLHYIKLD